MLTEFLEDMLEKKPNFLKDQLVSIDSQAQQDMIDIKKIQSTPIEKMDRQEKVKLMFILLKQLQPYLSTNNLTVPNQKQDDDTIDFGRFSKKRNTISQMGGSQTSRNMMNQGVDMMNLTMQATPTPMTTKASQAKRIQNNNFFGNNRFQTMLDFQPNLTRGK